MNKYDVSIIIVFLKNVNPIDRKVQHVISDVQSRLDYLKMVPIFPLVKMEDGTNQHQSVVYVST